LKKVGKGQVYYVGTNLGASIEEGSQPGIELVRTIVTNVVQRPVASDRIRPRLIESPNGSLLMVFNDNTADQTAQIRVPERYKQAVDVYSQRSQTIQDYKVQVDVPFESVSVFRLS
jgi:isocitrate dehydrogenase